MKNGKKHTLYPLHNEALVNSSGNYPNLQLLPKLRRGYFYKVEIDIGGDAPKNFIRVYEYGQCRRDKPKTWVAYIAKVGHKWYPAESITEYLMNRIGEEMGLDMAQSKLVLAGGQVRFLSKYFLNTKRKEQLIHGAQIYARHLDDMAFVELASQRKRRAITRELFTFQYTEEAIKAIFPTQQRSILEAFVKMLIYDALVGNNDRHFYNWGVITDLFGKITPRFSPIYDTARGLFWNESESKISEYLQSSEKLEKYIQKTSPRIGWDGSNGLNHFELIKKLFSQDQRYCDTCTNLLTAETEKQLMTLLNLEFARLFSAERLELIKRCIKLRIGKLQEIISS